MKAIANIAVVVAVITFVLAVISRFMFKPLALVPAGVGAGALLDFTNTCLLLAIALVLLEKNK